MFTVFFFFLVLKRLHVEEMTVVASVVRDQCGLAFIKELSYFNLRH